MLQTVSGLAEEEPELLSNLLRQLRLEVLWDELGRCLDVVAVLEGLTNGPSGSGGGEGGSGLMIEGR